jgi:hypothetical protein
VFKSVKYEINIKRFSVFILRGVPDVVEALRNIVRGETKLIVNQCKSG